MLVNIFFFFFQAEDGIRDVAVTGVQTCALPIFACRRLSKQSAGKRLSGKTTAGNTHLRALLGEAAWAAARTKGTYLSAYYHRIARRRGKKKAIVALEHKLLVIIYHVLLTKKPYSDLGADYFDQLEKTRLERHHIRRLEQLGYTVTITPKEAA